jgi:hypothetical protein
LRRIPSPILSLSRSTLIGRVRWLLFVVHNRRLLDHEHVQVHEHVNVHA